jgi:hypothetical protein
MKLRRGLQVKREIFFKKKRGYWGGTIHMNKCHPDLYSVGGVPSRTSSRQRSRSIHSRKYYRRGQEMV